MHPALRILAALSLAFLVCSCAGYRMASDREAPLNLPEKYRDLFIRNVENPTMTPGLEDSLRTALRDELTRRARVLWVPRERASAYVDMTIHRYTSQTSLTGTEDETIKSSASIDVSLVIVRRSDGSQLWRADHVGHSESFTGDDQAEAQKHVLNLAVRKIVDRLSQDY